MTKLTGEEREALAWAIVKAAEFGGAQTYGFNLHVWNAARDFYAARRGVALPNRESAFQALVTYFLKDRPAPDREDEGVIRIAAREALQVLNIVETEGLEK